MTGDITSPTSTMSDKKRRRDSPLSISRRPHLGAKVSEFSEAYRGAYAIHRALSTVVSKMTSGAPINVAEVIRQLGVEVSTIAEQELVADIARAAKEAGLKIQGDQDSIAI